MYMAHLTGCQGGCSRFALAGPFIARVEGSEAVASKSAGNSSDRTSHTGGAATLREPVQARAKATFDKILQAAIDILGEEGLAALNTNRIASQAGVNVATLYSYFSNKEHILAHLALHFENTRAASIEDHAASLGDDPNWERWFEDSIDSMVQFRLDEPGCLVVRQALLALPDLLEIDRESTRRATEAKIPGLQKLAPQLSESQARAVSHAYTLAPTAPCSWPTLARR